MDVLWLIRKDPDAGKDWRQEEKGTTEDEITRWHHQLDGHEFEQAPGVGDGQGSLVCCSPRGRKKLDLTEWLNWTEALLCVDYLPTVPFSVENARMLNHKQLLQVYWYWRMQTCRLFYNYESSPIAHFTLAQVNV